MNNFRSGLTNVEHFNKMGNPSNGPAMMKWFYILVKCSFFIQIKSHQMALPGGQRTTPNFPYFVSVYLIWPSTA